MSDSMSLENELDNGLRSAFSAEAESGRNSPTNNILLQDWYWGKARQGGLAERRQASENTGVRPAIMKEIGGIHVSVLVDQGDWEGLSALISVDHEGRYLQAVRTLPQKILRNLNLPENYRREITVIPAHGEDEDDE